MLVTLNSVTKEQSKSGGKIGRPSTVNEASITKLEAAFQRGYSVKKACEYARVRVPTFYQFYKDDESFRNKIDDAKNYWVLLAGDNITEVLRNKSPDVLKTRVSLSRWVFEKKMPDEYASKIENGGDTNNTNTQNNYLFITHEQLREFASTSGLTRANPVQLVKALTNSNMGRTDSETGVVDVY